MSNAYQRFFIKAGLLTSGSPYFPRLPVRLKQTVALVGFVPGHSGGTVTALNRLPF
jgi:hypothetical protein